MGNDWKNSDQPRAVYPNLVRLSLHFGGIDEHSSHMNELYAIERREKHVIQT